jgi:hypothetical protein
LPDSSTATTDIIFGILGGIALDSIDTNELVDNPDFFDPVNDPDSQNIDSLSVE